MLSIIRIQLLRDTFFIHEREETITSMEHRRLSLMLSFVVGEKECNKNELVLDLIFWEANVEKKRRSLEFCGNFMLCLFW